MLLRLGESLSFGLFGKYLKLFPADMTPWDLGALEELRMRGRRGDAEERRAPEAALLVDGVYDEIVRADVLVGRTIEGS